MIKKILLTGSSGGLGKVVAAELIKSGYDVVGLDRSDSTEISGIQHYQVDLLDEQRILELVRDEFEKEERFGAVLLAGGFSMGSIADSSLGDLDEMIDVNFKTAYTVCRSILRLNTPARVILVSAKSAFELGEASGVAKYALTKSMILTLSELINGDTKVTGIDSHVIAPSTIDTPANRKMMPTANFDDWVSTEQLGKIIKFLFSTEGLALRETVFKAYSNS